MNDPNVMREIARMTIRSGRTVLTIYSQDECATYAYSADWGGGSGLSPEEIDLRIRDVRENYSSAELTLVDVQRPRRFSLKGE